MPDREEARLWADHHSAFTRWVSQVAHDIGAAFAVLARIRYDEPWRDPNTR